MKELVSQKTLKGFPGLKIHILASMGYRKVTVHMFNPHVTGEDIVGFLKRYGRVNPEKMDKVMDRMGFWTGKREFRMILNEDPQGHDGLVHPPAFFAIGGDRGYLSYHRQPPFCKKCRGSGHKEEDCEEGARCRFCSSKDHVTKDCQKQKECHACGSADHLLKDCPRRPKARGGGPGKRAATEMTGDYGPSSSAGEGGQKDPQTSGKKEAASKTASAVGASKGGARTGSEAFNNGVGAAKNTLGEKKVNKHKDTEKVMESNQSGDEVTGGGLEGDRVSALSFDSGQPACLFGPASPEADLGQETPSYIK